MKITKKKVLFTIFGLLFLFGIALNVDAFCTSKKYSDLKMIAYKTEVSYELKFDSNHNAYFELTVNNVDENILVVFNGETYEPENGTVVIPDRISGGITYDIKLYGGYETACVEEYLYTKKITVPVYNKYSERDECIEYEEFYMCNKWYAGDIDSDQTFEVELENYINSLKEEEPEKKKTDNRNIFEKIIDFYKDHLIITLPITILIVLFVGYKVVVKMIRRKNRIKLDSK